MWSLQDWLPVGIVRVSVGVETTRLGFSWDGWGVGGVRRLQGGSERCCANVVIEVGVLLLLWLSLTGL